MSPNSLASQRVNLIIDTNAGHQYPTPVPATKIDRNSTRVSDAKARCKAFTSNSDYVAAL
jgi:hypothetical protein